MSKCECARGGCVCVWLCLGLCLCVRPWVCCACKCLIVHIKANCDVNHNLLHSSQGSASPPLSLDFSCRVRVGSNFKVFDFIIHEHKQLPTFWLPRWASQGIYTSNPCYLQETSTSLLKNNNNRLSVNPKIPKVVGCITSVSYRIDWTLTNNSVAGEKSKHTQWGMHSLWLILNYTIIHDRCSFLLTKNVYDDTQPHSLHP